jgi:hypothetical protein
MRAPLITDNETDALPKASVNGKSVTGESVERVAHRAACSTVRRPSGALTIAITGR